jgi:hypothetical protein
MLSAAPAFLNLYVRPSPSVTPTGPLDLTNGWCSPAPLQTCGGGASNPVPEILPGQAVVFTTTVDLVTPGLHDVYVYVDALGGNQGLNMESAEDNNSRWVGSVMVWKDFVFLPLIVRN